MVHARLEAEGLAASIDFIEPSPIHDEDVLRVHTRHYLEKIRKGTLSPREIALLEMPFSPALVDGVFLATGGTLLSCERATAFGCAVNLAGGYHHAFSDHGEGFCLVNDVAIAIETLRARGTIARAAVVDLDVHHGNGTSAIFADEPAVFTFSMHQENNYPAQKPPSDLDVGLPDGASDALYLDLLARYLPQVMASGPDLVVYLAGADPYREDRLGGLGLSLPGLLERDRRVLRVCREAAIPVAVVLAGGYAAKTADTVTIHVNTVRAAIECLNSR